MSFMPKIKVEKQLEKEIIKSEPEPEIESDGGRMDDIIQEQEDDEEFEEEEEEEEAPAAIKQEIIEKPLEVDDIFKKPPKLTKKGKQRKPMTEEHKQKLFKAREKAVIARRRIKAERLEAEALAKEEKDLLVKQKVKKVKKLKKEVEEDSDTEEPKKLVRQNAVAFSKEDLEDAQLEAIIKYEKLRKIRKKEKAEINEKEKANNELKKRLSNAIAPRIKNPFDICY